jgi:Zn-dependent protease
MFIFIFIFWLSYNFNFGNEFILQGLFLAAFMNLFLAIFNLIPIVPLDGSKILFSILPFDISRKLRYFMEKNYLYIFLIFLLVIFNTSFLSEYSFKIFQIIFNFFVN